MTVCFHAKPISRRHGFRIAGFHIPPIEPNQPMRLLSLLLLLSFFSFAACPAVAQRVATNKIKVKKASKKTVVKAAKPAPTASLPVLTFERTPCFGTCPGYKMEVYADGRVAYEGTRAVPIMGKKELTMPASAVSVLLSKASEAHFEKFEKRYSRNTSDLPSTIIGIRQPDGSLKMVTVEEGAPDNVKNLFAAFGTQLDQVAQLNGLEK